MSWEMVVVRVLFVVTVAAAAFHLQPFNFSWLQAR
jgi:hypothetical protein